MTNCFFSLETLLKVLQGGYTIVLQAWAWFSPNPLEKLLCLPGRFQILQKINLSLVSSWRIWQTSSGSSFVLRSPFQAVEHCFFVKFPVCLAHTAALECCHGQAFQNVPEMCSLSQLSTSHLLRLAWLAFS